MAHTTIPVRPGLNVWRLLRTDRDGVSTAELPQMSAAVTRYWLTNSLERGSKNELWQTGENEWRFGRVRPLHVLSVSRQPPSMPLGEIVATREGSVPEVIPTVRGTTPWWIVVEFWWRGSDISIPYPGVTSGILGKSYSLTDADWVLDRAVLPPERSDPGDETWGDAMGERAAEAAARATDALAEIAKGGIAGGIGLLALLWLMNKKFRA